MQPKFANNWYAEVSPQQLRQEVQGIFDTLSELDAREVDLSPVEGRVSALEGTVATLSSDISALWGALGGYLPLGGGTLTGMLVGTVLALNGATASPNGSISIGGTGANDGITFVNAGGGTARVYANDANNDFMVGARGGNSTNGLRIASDGIVYAGKGLSLDVALTTASAAVRADRQVIAGNGLTGGGNFQADRTVTLGTPGTITAATTNSVTSTSHTHSLTLPSTRNHGVGAYALMRRSGGTAVGDGATVSGSDLRYVTITRLSDGTLSYTDSSTTPTGTWRNLGAALASAAAMSLCVRTA